MIRTDQPPETVAELGRHLDEEERSRRAGAPAARSRFTVSHAAARLLTAAAAGVPPSEVRWRRGPHGRPDAEGPAARLTVNLSTAGPWSLFALAPAGADVGVDLEAEPPAAAALRLARRWFPPAEAAEVESAASPPARFAELWTRKEAYVKALGARLAEGLPVPAAGSPVSGPAGTCAVRPLALPPELRTHRAAVARRSTEPFAVRLRTWSPPSASRASREAHR
ncbi:4'-phosphopantetheinyl transferase family protein [Kitasatospora terrestris]|uniref:4'-phosphopantetheinyl transferase family protein n=1 Tax=Kitasatospora terrestris TaxID=258051 RepID=UPI0031EDC88A